VFQLRITDLCSQSQLPSIWFNCPDCGMIITYTMVCPTTCDYCGAVIPNATSLLMGGRFAKVAYHRRGRTFNRQREMHW